MNESTETGVEWPEWLTPQHSAIHTAIENEIKRALQHCYDSADGSGMPWTTEGWISCSASNVIGMLRRLGCPPPPVGEVEAIPLPREEADFDEADCEPCPADSVRSYTRKPVTVDAAQVTTDNLGEVAAWCGGSVDGSTIQIDDGERGYGGYAHPGDWVIRWPEGFTVMPDQEDEWSVGFHDEFEPCEVPDGTA